jgi:hypothetical protein
VAGAWRAKHKASSTELDLEQLSLDGGHVAEAPVHVNLLIEWHCFELCVTLILHYEGCTSLRMGGWMPGSATSSFSSMASTSRWSMNSSATGVNIPLVANQPTCRTSCTITNALMSTAVAANFLGSALGLTKCLHMHEATTAAGLLSLLPNVIKISHS